MQHKIINFAFLLILALVLPMLLMACSEQATPTTQTSGNPQNSATVFTISTNSTTTTNPSSVSPTVNSQTTQPTANATTLVQSTSMPTLAANTAMAAPTLAAPISNQISDNPTPVCTNSSMDIASQQTQNTAAIVSKLPHINGVVKLPVTNSPLCTAQPAPIIKANYGLNNTPRIGIQAGHYLIDQLPNEWASLRGQTGGSGGGLREVNLNLDIAKRVVALLQAKGATVDLLPATVPAGYTADAFVAIHADANSSEAPHGFKMSHSRFSPIPQTDDALLNSIFNAYQAATGLAVDDNITRDMTGYYAFYSRNRLYSVSKITPAMIIEMGYLTNPSDRAYMLDHSDTIAEAIANGIWNFIVNRPPLAQREQPLSQSKAIQVVNDNVPIYDSNGGIIAYVSKGQRFDFFDDKGSRYSVYAPIIHKQGFISKTDVTTLTTPR